MNNPQFAQQPCIKCGTTVWIAYAAGVGYCPSCHTPNSIQAAGAQPSQPGQPGQPGQPMGAPQQPGQPQQPMVQQQQHPAFAAAMMSGGRPKSKGAVIGGAVGLIVLSVLGSVGYYAFKQYIFRAKGHASAKDIGITDEKKADLEKMISGTQTLAKKWRSDAELAEINVQSFHSDGTVDLTKSAQIIYASAGRVKSTATAGEDSVKKFIFNDKNVDYSDVFGLTTTQPDFAPLPERKCTPEKLGKLMEKKGIKSAHLVMNDIAWHVLADDGGFYVDSTSSKCEEVKPNFGGGGGGDDDDK